jgi:hypothetical protein
VPTKTVLTREADLAVKRVQNARREAITTLSTSIEEKQQFDGNAKMAEAAFANRSTSTPVSYRFRAG